MSTKTRQITDEALENALTLARIERAEAFKDFFKSIAAFFTGFGKRSVPANSDARTV